MRIVRVGVVAGAASLLAAAASAQGGQVVELPALEVEGAPSPSQTFDKLRDETISPKIGATSYGLNGQAIQDLPQGEDTPLDKVVLQAPGVAYDSAISNPDFHIRNEYSNVQYRLNGVPLPLGVNGLGPVLDTSFLSGVTLLDGVLPAQYGLRTAGVLELTSKTPASSGEGSVSLYGGSHETLSPRMDYGGLVGDTQYFVSGRLLHSDLGLESATPGYNAVHDDTDQQKAFAYVSTRLGDANRLTWFAGVSNSRFQVPDIPGQTPLGDFGGLGVSSASLNDRQDERYVFNVVALRTHAGAYDGQLAFTTSYANVHFLPDVAGDLAFYDAASDVRRESLANGLQYDAAYRLDAAHTLRFGALGVAEKTNVDTGYAVLPLAAGGSALPSPLSLEDDSAKLGLTAGVYAQDEWRLTDKLTLNTGLRFDQVAQYVTANQLSPRVALSYRPDADTSLHIGYARYFTPPVQVQAAPTDLPLFANTALQPAIATADAVKPERSHYFDLGADRMVLPGLTLGGDVYLKLATDILDDGQFGPAPVLTEFNYARGYGEGVELKATYTHDGFRAYANLSANKTQGEDVVSNQYLFDDPAEFAYAKTHYIYLDDAQTYTASAGASYRWNDTLFTTDLIYGSGLRSGFANLETVKPYVQVNLGLTHEFKTPDKPLTVRFDVVNLFDNPYLLRDGDGIGQFAPQYGPRRSFYLTLTQKI